MPELFRVVPGFARAAAAVLDARRVDFERRDRRLRRTDIPDSRSSRSYSRSEGCRPRPRPVTKGFGVCPKQSQRRDVARRDRRRNELDPSDRRRARSSFRHLANRAQSARNGASGRRRSARPRPLEQEGGAARRRRDREVRRSRARGRRGGRARGRDVGGARGAATAKNSSPRSARRAASRSRCSAISKRRGLIHLGVSRGYPIGNRVACIFDIGGGSTEFIVADARATVFLAQRASRQLAALRRVPARRREPPALSRSRSARQTSSRPLHRRNSTSIASIS